LIDENHVEELINVKETDHLHHCHLLASEGVLDLDRTLQQVLFGPYNKKIFVNFAIPHKAGSSKPLNAGYLLTG